MHLAVQTAQNLKKSWQSFPPSLYHAKGKANYNMEALIKVVEELLNKLNSIN
jgi:CRISPR/Cas system CSM-associated protein Csm2 small subunit